MNPRVAQVSPEKDYKLRLMFTNGEVGIFDMKPYLDRGIFQELKDLKIFQTVIVSNGLTDRICAQTLCI